MSTKCSQCTQISGSCDIFVLPPTAQGQENQPPGNGWSGAVIMESCLEIIYFISHLLDGEGCCLLTGREVLRCLLMVSTEKQRNENADISKKCHSQCVLWLCLLLFHPYRSQRILVCTDLDSRHKARMPAGLGASQKKRLGLGVPWADSFKKGWVIEVYFYSRSWSLWSIIGRKASQPWHSPFLGDHELTAQSLSCTPSSIYKMRV